MSDEKFIQSAIKHPGALRKKLKVKKDEKIPLTKLKKAEHSKNPKTRKQAVLAETLRNMPKKSKGMSHVSPKRIHAYAKKKG